MKKMFYDDFGCWLDILRAGGGASGLQEDLMRYRVMDGSVSAKQTSLSNGGLENVSAGGEASIRGCFDLLHQCMPVRALLKYREF